MKNVLLSNKFIEKILNINTEIIKKNPLTKEDIKRFRKGEKPKRWNVSQSERYCIDIFQKIMGILDTIEDLKAVQIFLRQYPYSETLKKHKITKSFYFRYHIEFYLIKLVSLRDKMTLLLNEVFNLGLPDKQVKIDLISKMKQTKGKPIIKLLKSFSDSITAMTCSKNIIVHKERYDDKNLLKLRMYEMLDDGGKVISPGIFKVMASLYINEKRKIFKKNQKNIEKFLDKFFLVLDKEFDREYKKLIKK